MPELRDDHGFRTAESFADVLAQGAEIGEERKRAPAAVPIIGTLARVQAAERTGGGFQRRLRANLLLLVDQLENIFAADIGDDQRSAFARLIFALCATRRVWVAATVRSDIYPRLITPGDFLALKDAGGVYDLAAPGESELTEIVHKSAAAAGLVYETNRETGERLDERILKDALGKNTLPLLQFALDRLFKDRELVTGREIVDEREVVREEVRLTFAAYEAMHGLDGAINQSAEAALAGLDQAAIDSLPRLLRCLAVPVHDRKSATAAGSDLTVRTVTRHEAVPDTATDRLVRALIDTRIVTAGSADTAGATDEGLSVSHQRVFESWERARGIVSEHKEFFRIRDEVEAQRQRWQERGRPSALLVPKGVPLAEAQKIVEDYGEELDGDVRSYVAASGRRAQRLNIFMGATAAVFAVLFVAAAMLWFAAERAEQAATTSYGAAKGALSDLVSVITDGLRDIEGIRVATVQNILGIVDKTIQKVQRVSLEDSQLARIRADMMFQFGKAFQKKEDLESAARAAEESLIIRSNLTHFDRWKSAPAVFEATPADWRWELSQSLEFVGDLRRLVQNFQEARARFEETLAVRLQLVAHTPDNHDWAHGLCFVYVRLGDLDFNSNLTAAQRNYENSLALAAKYFDRNSADGRWQRELSWSFNKVGDVRARKGDDLAKAGDTTAKRVEYSAALAAFDHSLCLRRQISARSPSRTELTRDIAFSLDRIGRARHQLDDPPGAELAYFEALAIRRRLASSVPDNILFLGDVAASLQLIGDYFLARDDLKGALAFYDAAVDVRLEVTLKAPNDERARQNLTNAERRAEAARKRAMEKHAGEDFSGRWWQHSVAEAQNAYAKRLDERSLDLDACWSSVVASVKEMIATTGAIR